MHGASACVDYLLLLCLSLFLFLLLMLMLMLLLLSRTALRAARSDAEDSGGRPGRAYGDGRGGTLEPQATSENTAREARIEADPTHRQTQKRCNLTNTGACPTSQGAAAVLRLQPQAAATHLFSPASMRCPPTSCTRCLGPHTKRQRVSRNLRRELPREVPRRDIGRHVNRASVVGLNGHGVHHEAVGRAARTAARFPRRRG